MLTAGIEAALGKSILTGLCDGGTAARLAAAAGLASASGVSGAFQPGA